MKELEIKTTMRYPYTLISMHKTHTLTSPNVGNEVEQQKFFHYWWEYGTATLEDTLGTSYKTYFYNTIQDLCSLSLTQSN